MYEPKLETRIGETLQRMLKRKQDSARVLPNFPFKVKNAAIATRCLHNKINQLNGDRKRQSAKDTPLEIIYF